MNELITITKTTINDEEVNAVNARELWERLEIGTKFNTWMPRRIEEYGFEEGRDFVTILGKSHGRPSKEYIISLDMAKELAMVEKQYRKQENEKLPTPEVLMATLCTEMERRIKAEAERDEYRRNLQRIALASGLDYGAISETTGLPKDIVVPTYCRSSKREHAPQAARFIQLILPLREIIHELRIENNA